MRRKPWWVWVGVVVVGYVTIAALVFRFRHPEMTETELFLRLPAAVMWAR